MGKRRAPSVRVIAGHLRSRRIYLQNSESEVKLTDDMAQDIRPTGDRVRETLFNWLHFLFDHQWSSIDALDCFAGSASLSIESISRGANHCTVIEKNKNHYKAILENIQALGIESSKISVHFSDFFQWIAGCKRKYNLIFLDPPYSLLPTEHLLESIMPVLKEGGIVYLERSIDEPFTAFEGWEVLRLLKTSNSRALLLHRPSSVAKDTE